MFDQIFERSHAIQHQLAAPLLEARLAYLRQHAEQGASRSSLRKLAQYLLVVTERLNLHLDGEAVTGEMVERAADRWARRRPRHPHMKAAFSALSKARFLWVATNWLRFLDRLVKPQTQTTSLCPARGGFCEVHAGGTGPVSRNHPTTLLGRRRLS